MDSICIHTENQTIICETCKTYICPDCVVDKFNSHRQHSLVTPRGLVDRHKKFIQDRISKLNTNIKKIDTEMEELITKKKELVALDSDSMLLLSFLNTTSTQCATHDIKSEAVCNQCKVCVCIKCLIDLKCVHRDHNLSTIGDKITSLAKSNEKSINSIEKKLECLTLAKNEHVNELNAVQSITVTDSEIINNYLANNKITDQSEITVTENSIYELDYAINKGLKWSLKTELITENCELFLGSGYYMIIAVGGGASGGIFKYKNQHYSYNDNKISVCGGECGAITAKILQVTHDTVVNIEVGKCGSSKPIDNHGTKILDGSDTRITFGTDTIIAVGGKYRQNASGKTNAVTFNGGGSNSTWAVYLDNDNFGTIKNNLVTINKICDIFPVVYPGLEFSRAKDVQPPGSHNDSHYNGSHSNNRIGKPGDSGICLANINKIIKKNITISDNIKFKGFGSGGHGSSLLTYQYQYNYSPAPLSGSDGTNGCVIIAYLE